MQHTRSVKLETKEVIADAASPDQGRNRQLPVEQQQGLQPEALRIAGDRLVQRQADRLDVVVMPVDVVPMTMPRVAVAKGMVMMIKMVVPIVAMILSRKRRCPGSGNTL